MDQRQALWQINQRFRNKRDLYNFKADHLVSHLVCITCHLQRLYLPKFESCPLGFLQDILRGRKQAMERTRVR
jgi:hypothetical protein